MRALAWVAAASLVAPPAASARSASVVQKVTPKAFAYVPTDLTAPAPLIVLLHGSGGDARYFLDQFKRDADARGVILLSVQSSGPTWAQRKPTDGEADVADIKAAIAELSTKTSIDSHRTAVMGFSDGASYALSVGLAYPDLFRSIVAFSPGYAFGPSELDTSQRIFISHARRDPVLPANNVRAMVSAFEKAGYSPEVHWFNGGHEIDPDLKKAAFDFAVAP